MLTLRTHPDQQRLNEYDHNPTSTNSHHNYTESYLQKRRHIRLLHEAGPPAVGDVRWRELLHLFSDEIDRNRIARAFGIDPTSTKRVLTRNLDAVASEFFARRLYANLARDSESRDAMHLLCMLNKHGYEFDMFRDAYLVRLFEHGFISTSLPSLSDVRTWVEEHLPSVRRFDLLFASRRDVKGNYFLDRFAVFYHKGYANRRAIEERQSYYLDNREWQFIPVKEDPANS